MSRRGGLMKRRPPDIAVIRRREIERHARHVGAAETDDFERWLIAWCWHNGHSKDPAGALVDAAIRMGGMCSITKAENILEQAKATPQRRKAHTLGKFLGVTYEQRRRCGIKTFGPHTPPAIRKEQNRMIHETRRRAKGARPREEYLAANLLTRTKPWVAEGISRRTWYRRRQDMRDTSPSSAIPPLRNLATIGTSPSSASSLFVADTPVPAETPQAVAAKGTEPCGYGKHFTARWIAARQKACGLRHNRWQMTDQRQEAAE
jgi:hypothetical protein